MQHVGVQGKSSEWQALVLQQDLKQKGETDKLENESDNFLKGGFLLQLPRHMIPRSGKLGPGRVEVATRLQLRGLRQGQAETARAVFQKLGQGLQAVPHLPSMHQCLQAAQKSLPDPAGSASKQKGDLNSWPRPAPNLSCKKVIPTLGLWMRGHTLSWNSSCWVTFHLIHGFSYDVMRCRDPVVSHRARHVAGASFAEVRPKSLNNPRRIIEVNKY